MKPMWCAHTEEPDPGRVRRVVISRGPRVLRYAEVISGWEEDPDFRSFFNAQLAAAPFAAYYWETPPVTRAGVDRDFECVLVDSPALAGIRPDPRAFGEHFEAGCGGQDVLAFPNLGNDALLVAPCPGEPLAACAHIGAFSRSAPENQQQSLWQQVGNSLRQRLGRDPVWMSTAGQGVSWLHVRLDSYPKYYSHAPYRAVDRQ